MKNAIERSEHSAELQRLLDDFPVVAILGARQVGKTTLANSLLERHRGPKTHFDLENPSDRAALRDPMLALEPLRGWVVLDEIQHAPELFAVLRVLADRPDKPARFLVLGSASPEFLRQSSESLAGRIAYHELDGFDLAEVGADNLERLWLRGGFPLAYLASTEAKSATWRESFLRTFLERDIPQLGLKIPAPTLRRFWTMVAHYHGQIWNASEFARSFGVSDVTVRRYLDLLSATFVITQLQPWSANIGKRQVKSPKVYITDSGLLHALLGLTTRRDVDAHPKFGASWEGFLIQQVVRRVHAQRHECFFWATHAGAELDLLIVRGRRRIGFEFKRTVAPEITPSMRIALDDLKLEQINVIHAGEHTFAMADKIRAIAARRLLRDVKP